MKSFVAYTDGSCDNTGDRVGGWAFVLYAKGQRVKAADFELDTTNNRMELIAILKVLSYLKKHHPESAGDIEIFSDSQYCVNGASSWLAGWKADGRLQSGEIKNPDLWQGLDILIETLNPVFTWVKGHADSVNNIICDQLAGDARLSKRPFFIKESSW